MDASESLGDVAPGEVYARSPNEVFLPATPERSLQVIQGKVLEHLRLLAPSCEHRDRRAFDPLSLLVPEHELDDAVRLGVRQRPQQDRVDDGEDRRVSADAQRERQDRHRGEAGTLPQYPHCIKKILKEILDAIHPSPIAAFLFPLFESIHGAESGMARLLGAQALGDMFLNLSLQVIPQFLIQFRLDPPSAEKRAQS